MSLTIAIHPDDYTASGKPPDSDASSPKWARLLQEAGHQVRWVDVFRPDIIDQLRGCHGFMWRWAQFRGMYRVARRLLPVIEKELGLVTYPDLNTCWHYDDKITQWYLLSAVGIPVPKTWVWYAREDARNWAHSAPYPIVLKLAGGAGSENVRLLHSFSEAEYWLDKLFSHGVYRLAETSSRRWRFGIRRFRSAAKLILQGIPPQPPRPPPNAGELHRNYVLLQEFLPDNAFDTRITVIGNRAFGFRRFNRDNDFRASGSGKIDYTVSDISPDFVRLAFQVAHRLQTQSCAIDGLRRSKQPVVGEISYTYVSWLVHDCPGHWELLDEDLKWCEGHMWPEEAQIQDFLVRLKTKYA
jgi:hypothetical protein